MVVSEGVPVPLTLSCLLLLPDKQSSSASLETLLALLQAEGAKIEEDTEVNPASPAGRPRAVTWAWAQFPQGQACRLRRVGSPARGLGRAPAWGPGRQRGRSGPQVRGTRYTVNRSPSCLRQLAGQSLWARPAEHPRLKPR